MHPDYTTAQFFWDMVETIRAFAPWAVAMLSALIPINFVIGWLMDSAEGIITRSFGRRK